MKNRLSKHLLTAFLLSSAGSAQLALANTYTVPAMVKIPAGTFVMGSDLGDKVAQPAHHVNVGSFQLAKYPVTVSEFRQFVNETGYKAATNCKDKLSENWLSGPTDIGTASWDKHRLLISEFQPVTCTSWKDINAYIEWLNEKTGTQYRLPTEQEWEYAVKGNSTSRYFWGDDPNLTQACKYGNFADQSSEYFASQTYGASYVGFINYSDCDDHEPYITLVGMYRPNPFGLYDMLGNASQYLSTCFYRGYEVKSDQEMDIEKCETVAHRGFDWHFAAQPHTDRGRFNKDWAPGFGMGFRLAADNHKDWLHSSTISFEQDLAAAQAERLKNRPQLPQIPKQPLLIKQPSGKFTLNWEPVADERVIAYEIYKSKVAYSHVRAGHYKKHYDKVKTVERGQYSFDVSLPVEGGSYRVVAKSVDLTSIPSKPAIHSTAVVNKLPGRLDMQYARNVQTAHLAHRAKTEEKPELFYLTGFIKGFEQPQISASFEVEVEKSGWYSVNYNGASRLEGEFFKLWNGNKLLGSFDYDFNIKDSESNRHKVYLQAGNQQIEFTMKRDGLDIWALGWIEFTPLEG